MEKNMAHEVATRDYVGMYGSLPKSGRYWDP